MSRYHRTEFDFLPERAFQPRTNKFGSMTLEGGIMGGGKGGSSPDAPDAQWLEDIKAANVGFKDSMKGVQDNIDYMSPIQKAELEKSISRNDTAYQQTQDDRDYALDRRGGLTRMQDRMLADADSFSATDRAGQMGQQAMEDYTAQSNNGAMERSFAARGINAGSGAAMAALAGRGTQDSLNKARIGNDVARAARLEGYQLTDRAAGALSYAPGMATSMTTAGAGVGGAGVGYADTTATGLNKGYAAKGALATGLSNSAQGAYGGQAKFNASKAEAENSGSDPFGSIVGMAAGAAASSFGGPAGAAAAKYVMG